MSAMDIEAEFDRPDGDSPFLTFVAREFQGRGTELRKELASKSDAATFVSDLGLRIPKKYKVLPDIDRLNLLHLRKRVVLKYAKGWSARGVMLLERVGFNRYFDYMSLKTFSIGAIKNHQRSVARSFNDNDPYWILEEFLEPIQAWGAIPFDYKCYVFGAQIGLIVQIDRNSSPPRVSLFDGSFKPLKSGKDYVLASKNAQHGVPSVPLHAPEIQWWAIKLSTMTDAPFVSIDMYDTPAGPVFGEFTFSPGGTHKRMFKFSHALLDHFDRLFAASEAHLCKGWDGDGDYPVSKVTDYQAKLRAQSIMAVQSRNQIAQELYKACSGVAYNIGSRGALRLMDIYEELAGQADIEVHKLCAKWLSRAWRFVRDDLQVRAQEEKVDAE